MINKDNKSNQYQEVVLENEAHKKLLDGATILHEAVSCTMGPSGHNVAIDTPSGPPLITRDGVTVAKSINLKEKLPRMGAELLKEIASKTNELCGDGTTSSVVLGYEMLRQGIKMIATGRSAIGIKRGMELATGKIIEHLKESAIQIRDNQDIVNVGTISANGDRKIGELLAEAVGKVGSDGIITIEPAKSVQTTLEVTEGMQFESGFVSPYFVTNQEKMNVELQNPLILITNRKISNLNELLPLLESVAKQNKPLLIIGDEIEGEALHTLILNKMRNNLNVCAVKAPLYGEYRTDVLSDIALITNAKQVFDSSSGTSLKNATVSDLGSCKKIIVTRTTTILVGDTNNTSIKEKINERVASLKTLLLDGTLDDLHVDKYKKRLAKLSGGVAVVKVGGSTEVEIFEKKDRVEDALNATLAAIQEGIVPGGGSALFYAADSVEKSIKNLLSSSENLSEDEIAGVDIVLEACRKPLKTIVKNTGKSPEVVINELQKEKNNIRYGYNAYKHEYCDLIDSGVIDPLKVERFALEHATSIIGLVLTCNAFIVNHEENEEE